MSTAPAHALDRLIGTSGALRELRAYIPKVAAGDCNVLITGETGTGKERVAEAIHATSPRKDGNLICINCAAIPDSLFESELFGYEKGAFTGAAVRREGRLQQANGGTVFLDEIGDLPLVSQAKILRAIEQKQVSRVGGREAERLNVRFIAATNQDLSQMVAAKQFRSDLYYRLNVVNIKLPPLRERREDIGLLFAHHLRELHRSDWGDANRLTVDALSALLNYEWPGNVRELRNLVELLLIDPARERFDVNDLPDHMRSQQSNDRLSERERLIEALVTTRWNRSAAAKKLHCSRMTLYRKMLKYDLENSGNSAHLQYETSRSESPPRIKVRDTVTSDVTHPHAATPRI